MILLGMFKDGCLIDGKCCTYGRFHIHTYISIQVYSWNSTVQAVMAGICSDI